MKKNLLKIMSVLCAGAMSFSMLAACKSGGDDGKGGSGAKVTLSVWCTDEDSELTEQLCNKYIQENNKTNLTILYGICSESSAATTVTSDPQNGPDVFAFASDQLNNLAKSGCLASFTDTGSDNSVYAQITREHLSSAVEAATVSYKTINADGTITEVNKGIQAFPITSDNSYFLYYDKSVLTETDVQTFQGIFDKISTNANYQFYMDHDNGFYGAGFYFAYEDVNYTEYYDNALNTIARDVNWDNENGLKATKAIEYIYNGCGHGQGFFVSGDDSVVKAGFAAPVGQKKVVAGITGTWNDVAIKQALGSNYAVAELPKFTDGESSAETQMGAFCGYKLMGVNKTKDADTVREATLLAQYLTNEQSQIKRYEMRNLLPSNKAALESTTVAASPITAIIKARATNTTIYRAQKNVPDTIWDSIAAIGTDASDSSSTKTAQELLTTSAEALQGSVKTSAQYKATELGL